VALSLVVSLSVAAVVSLVASLLPWGLGAVPVVAGVSAVTFLAALVAAPRRQRIPPEARPVRGDVPAMTNAVEDRSAVTVVLDVVVIVSVVLALGTAAVDPFAPTGSERFSEYQLLTVEDDGTLVATGYPTRATDVADEGLIIRVANHEGRPVNYTVIVQFQRTDAGSGIGSVAEAVELDRFSVRVAAGSERTVRRAPDLPDNGGGRLVYLFYAGHAPADPSRRTADSALHLWFGSGGGGVSDARSPRRGLPTRGQPLHCFQ
jgi:uncharacterized membrane protein